MNSDSFGTKSITDKSDSSTAISSITYDIENGHFDGMSSIEILRSIEILQADKEFPSNLEYVDSFYDEETSSSGVAFKDTTTGEVIVGFAGTNMDNGMDETMKDVQTNLEIGMTGLSFEERLKPIETFMSILHKFL